MDNQFCKSCGQANFPNATVCSKCGQALSPAESNPFNQPNQQPDFGAQNQAPVSSDPPKKSNLKFWVIGGVFAVGLLLLGLALVVGIGAFFYLNQADDSVITREERKPEPTSSSDSNTSNDSGNPLDDIDFPSSGDTDFGGGNSGSVTDSVLVKFFREKKSRVGAYRLSSARAMEGGGFFPGKEAGARGVYLSGRKSIVHEISVYRSKDTAKSDFASFKRRVRRDGGKIRSNKGEQIIFSMKKLVYLGFLNPQGGIHLISARNGNDIITYYNAYFK